MATNFKNGISDAIISKGLTEEILAKKLGLELSVIIGIELGVKFPTIETLKKMGLILDSSCDMLLTNEKREPLCLEGLSKEQKKIIWSIYNNLTKGV